MFSLQTKIESRSPGGRNHMFSQRKGVAKAFTRETSVPHDRCKSGL